MLAQRRKARSAQRTLDIRGAHRCAEKEEEHEHAQRLGRVREQTVAQGRVRAQPQQQAW